MLIRLQSVLGIIVVWSSFQIAAHAFFFTVGSPTQCDALTVSWTGGTPPFQLLITPVFGVPSNVSIPSNTFKDGQGSSSIQVAYAAGQKLLFTMSDATGFGSGGSTGVLVVGSSQGGTCEVRGPTLGFNFQLNSALQQCRPYTISGYSGAVQPVTFIGIVPGGTSMSLNLPLASGSFDWNADVAEGTSMIFLMVDAAGRSGGSSDIIAVGASDDGSCLNNLSPSSTLAASTSSASSTSIASSTSSGPSSSSSAILASKPSKGSPIAVIVGGVIGALLFLASVIALGLFFIRKRRDTWSGGNSNIMQPRRTRSQVDLTYDPGYYVPTMHPYTSGSATPMTSPTPFSDSYSYLDEPHQLHSKYSPSTAPSQYQSLSLSMPDSDQFNPYMRNEVAHSIIVQPFVNPPPPRDSISTAKRTAALAGTSAYTPSPRFIVHTDVEDDLHPSEDEIVELPPLYSDRRSLSPHLSPVLSSNTQFMQGSAPPLSKP